MSERVRFLLGVPQDTSSLSSSMRLAIAADTLALGDEGAGAEIEIRSSAAAHMGFTPIETESLSKGGFERICQGSAIFVSWPVTVAPGASSDAALDVVPRAIPRVP